jgi:hypothetical protein
MHTTSRRGYLTIARFGGEPGRLIDDYERSASVMSQVGRDHGLILHAAAPADDGLLIVNIWPSSEGSEAAARDPRRLAVLAQLDLDPGQVTREHFDLASLELRP